MGAMTDSDFWRDAARCWADHLALIDKHIRRVRMIERAGIFIVAFSVAGAAIPSRWSAINAFNLTLAVLWAVIFLFNRSTMRSLRQARCCVVELIDMIERLAEKQP
jgi:hypothetical protein